MSTTHLGLLDNRPDNIYLGSLNLNSVSPTISQSSFSQRVPTPPPQDVDAMPPSMRRGYRPPLGRTFTFPTSSSRDGAQEDQQQQQDLTISNLDPHAPLSMMQMSALDALAAAASLSSPSTSLPTPSLDAQAPFSTEPTSWAWGSGPNDENTLNYTLNYDDQIAPSIGPLRRMGTRLIDRAKSFDVPSRSASPTSAPPRSTASTPPRDTPGGLARRRPPRTRLPVPTPNVSRPSRGRHVPTAPTGEGGGEQSAATSASSYAGSDGERPIHVPQRSRGKGSVKDGEDAAARVFVCEVEACGKCFRRREHLKRHMLSLHTNDRPFRCPDCDKVCNRRDNLVQHRKIHAQDAAKN